MAEILIVDDDPIARSMLKFRLGDEDGHNVFLAEDGMAGLKIARKMLPDIILLDWVMPKMSGLKVLKALKDDYKTKHIPIYMLTGRGKMSDAEKAFDFGAEGYFTKPISPSEISKRIDKALQERNCK